MKVKKIFFILFSTIIGLHADYEIPQDNSKDTSNYPAYSGNPQQQNSVIDASQGGGQGQQQYVMPQQDVDPKVVEAENYLKFYSQRKSIGKVINRDREIQNQFHEYKHLKVANFTKKYVMRDVNSILMHPDYPQTILLPTSATITNVYAYPPTVQPNYQYNRIDIIPSANMLRTNLVVTFLEGNQVKNTTFLIQKVENNKHSLIYPIIAYFYPNRIDADSIIEKYYSTYKVMPTNKSSINIAGTVYQFFEDNINGNIKIGGKNYSMKVYNE